jgi:hypothetical protein
MPRLAKALAFLAKSRPKRSSEKVKIEVVISKTGSISILGHVFLHHAKVSPAIRDELRRNKLIIEGFDGLLEGFLVVDQDASNLILSSIAENISRRIEKAPCGGHKGRKILYYAEYSITQSSHHPTKDGHLATSNSPQLPTSGRTSTAGEATAREAYCHYSLLQENIPHHCGALANGVCLMSKDCFRLPWQSMQHRGLIQALLAA